MAKNFLPPISELEKLITMKRAIKKAGDVAIPFTELWLEEHIGDALSKRNYSISDGVFVVDSRNNTVLSTATNFGILAQMLKGYNLADVEHLSIFVYKKVEVE